MSTITLIDKSVLIGRRQLNRKLAKDLYITTAVLQVSTCLRVVESGPGTSPQWSAAVVPICRPRPLAHAAAWNCRVPVPRRAFEVTIFSPIFPIEITIYYTVAIQNRHQIIIIIIIIIKHFRARVPPLLSAGGTLAPRAHNMPIIIKLRCVAPLDERIFRNSLV